MGRLGSTLRSTSRTELARDNGLLVALNLGEEPLLLQPAGKFFAVFASAESPEFDGLHLSGNGRNTELLRTDGTALQQFPSRSYTFNRLGDSLPEYIASSTRQRRTFLRVLAKLELAMTQVFDEEENEPADLTQMPADRADVMRLVPINAFRMLALDYDANEAFSAFREGAHIHPRRKKTYLFIYRRDYSVYRVPLVKSAYDFLQQIVSGKTIGQAIEICRPKQQQLFEWFRDWSAAGIFRSFGE